MVDDTNLEAVVWRAWYKGGAKGQDIATESVVTVLLVGRATGGLRSIGELKTIGVAFFLRTM